MAPFHPRKIRQQSSVSSGDLEALPPGDMIAIEYPRGTIEAYRHVQSDTPYDRQYAISIRAYRKIEVAGIPAFRELPDYDVQVYTVKAAARTIRLAEREEGLCHP